MVNIEIDGIPLKVDSTKMIIQAADEAGIDIPRFCYHKKLSIAANCRMCLVEVDRARKALPACSTPVSEGMRVFTDSKVAINAQRSVMEFLLINHPLDCPICDQGGECELQDLSMGYGDGVSRFTEGKRVVKDKNIGPLIQTDMTRCIHCTRCVRFGQEIAGVMELGATGRGEHMEIGTYVEHSLVSELSGNIIDLCPVGALTSKPFRYKARAWELTAHPTIAPHDAVGSNIELHIRKNDVMRVVPRDNEAINEAWLSDRDRFSYLGLNSSERVAEPMIKKDGHWQTTDWQTALETAVDGLKTIVTKHGPEELGGLISPTATLEEAYLFQKWLRGLGTENIDHRLRQQDFADSQSDYALDDDWSLADIDDSDAIVLLGSNIRAEQPIIAHRIRQAALSGAMVSTINFFEKDLLMPVQHQLAVDAKGMAYTLVGIAKALTQANKEDAREWRELLGERRPSPFEQNVALQLSNAMNATLFVGDLINHHPHASVFRALAKLIASLSKTTLVILPTANSNAHLKAGTLPSEKGMNTTQMWQNDLRSYVLMGVDPLMDTAIPAQARRALKRASFVVAINSFNSDLVKEHADVILPAACFTETSGTFIGVDQQWQRFAGGVEARGDSRPGWKILRVLGNVSKLNGFEHISSQDVVDEVESEVNRGQKRVFHDVLPESLSLKSDLMLISEVPMYRTDSLLRHSNALQQTPENKANDVARMNQKEADKRRVSHQLPVTIKQGENQISLPLEIDDAIADGCIYVAAATQATIGLGAMFGQVEVMQSGSA